MLSGASNAKINLNLRIVGHDGNFHLLQSYFYPIHSLVDNIQISIADLDQVIIKRESYIPEFTDTIISKTIRAMRSQLNFKDCFNVKLHKRIPLGGGLGGGSGNAAAMINAIDQLLGLGLSLDEKCQIGKTIGADVSFFLYNKPCIVEGFGEVITPIQDEQNHHILIVVPDFGCSTQEVFKLYRNSGKEFSGKLSHQELTEKICYNDLTGYACMYNPKIVDILSAIANCKGCSGSTISGTGATCFGIFESVKDLKNANNTLRSLYPNFQVYIT